MCSFTAISPHLPDLGTPKVAVWRRSGFRDGAGISGLFAGAAAAGELVERLELSFEPPPAARMTINATSASTTATNAGTIHRTTFIPRPSR